MNANIERLKRLQDSKLPVAVIPARGGSKRILRKNIRLFNGYPMISYAINTLLESGIFSDVIVSTDDLEIAKISETLGAFVPFIRSSELSGDDVGTLEVIADFVRVLNFNSNRIVCCVYATNPFLSVANLVEGFNQITKTHLADYVCAITKYNYPIQRALALDKNGLMQMAVPENLFLHSQTLENRWHDAGQFYFARAITWLTKKPMLLNTIGIEIEKWRSVDIDDEEDWIKAQQLHKLE